MKFAEIRDGLADIVEKYKEMPRGDFEDTKVAYKGLLAEHKVSTWEKETGISVTNPVMLNAIDCEAPIWQSLELIYELNDEDEEGELRHYTKFGLLGAAGYVLLHPIKFVKDLAVYANAWRPSEYMMEQHREIKEKKGTLDF